MSFRTYLLRCADGSYHVGHTDDVGQHDAGGIEGLAPSQRPPTLVWSQEFSSLTEAREAEQRIRGWSGAEIAALVAGDRGVVSQLARTNFALRRFFAPAQLAHAPVHEFYNGALADFAEVPRRAEAILAAIGGAEAPEDRGEAAIRAVHDGGYVDFLKTAHARWLAAGRVGDAIGYAWPVVRRRVVALDRIDALLGRYTADACTPIAAGTWEAAYGSVQSALAATCAVLAGDRAAFALCRPPGHHAGADYAGGYCFLNAAAIAAQAARDAGANRVAILDIDYHHGNGTQDIFYARDDVFFASLHADPVRDFPYFWGHADERGEDAGEGFTLNLPLPHGTRADTFRRAQGQALDAIARFGPDLLIVSFGADTFSGDPISRFAIETADYALLAGDVAACGWPTVIVMEGGYAVDALGANVASFLSGF